LLGGHRCWSGGMDARAAASGGGSYGCFSGEHHGDGGGCILLPFGRQWMHRWVARARSLPAVLRSEAGCLLLVHALRSSLCHGVVTERKLRALAQTMVTPAGCHFPLEDIVEVLFSVPGFQVKTLVLWTQRRRCFPS
jgi:hypothetical protein